MSKYIARKYLKENLNQWDDFVESSINGTLFHQQKFISYHPEERFTDCSVVIEKDGRIFAVFPAAKIVKDNIILLKSHPGTSYGGLVFKEVPKLKEVFEVIKCLENFAIQNDCNRIEFRHSPKIFRKQPLDQIDFALIHNDYIRKEQELSTCFELPIYKALSIEEMLLLFNKNGRTKVVKNVKKAIRNGLYFEEFFQNDIPQYHSILSSNLKKHNASPVHSIDELIKLKNLYPTKVRFFGVFYKKQLIAGYLIFKINSQGYHIFYGSIDYEFQDLRASSFGLFMLLRQCANEHCQYLNMGISTENGGKIINWSLYDFKESFNGTGILRNYWMKDLN